ncbi:HET-domain-containing protein [Zopfia rhizophila CBS 207.26]|uniref:HET-domain-containing protein n=1 Tax=Zopfia rhizophila CBS 207.26 TaxID=1314779 RepID=A0A6A6DXA7_9PEZI|nr:HET-domain-containing protein [Zopfia rhizophila CBS 207.26]
MADNAFPMRLCRLRENGEFSLVEFVGNSSPRYAVLSHTWGADNEEVTYKDLVGSLSMSKAGYNKIRFCGEQAAKDGLLYFWVDTCCIDKSSSAELSEAINSMYQWYRNAEVCYAYLSDVSVMTGNIVGPSTPSEFEESRWFTRGWTLQELLAPTHLLFFDKNWQRIGSRLDLEEHVTKTTGISSAALRGKELRSFTVAQRMCWASKRKTTRVEDLAYCLLGIFDVNMPLLYGEGQKSFIRLQEGIMKSTEDQTLFAWKDPDLPPRFSTGLLARNPGCFADSGYFSFLEVWRRSVPSEATSKGIYTSLFLIPSDTGDVYRACLGCSVDVFCNDSPAIYLRRTSNLRTTFEKENEYTRILAGRLDILAGTEKVEGKHEEIYVRKLDDVRLDRVQEYRNVNVFWINIGLCRVCPERQWDPQSEIFWSPNTVHGKVGAVQYRSLSTPFLIIFGISPSGQPWCHSTMTTWPDSFRAWESYEPNETECAESYLDLDTSKIRFPIGGNRKERFSVFVEIKEYMVYSTTVYRVKARSTNEDTGESRRL